MSETTIMKQILGLLQDPSYRPMKQHGILNELGIPHGQQAALRDALRQLESKGRVQRLKGNRFQLAAFPDAVPRALVAGKLTIHPRGFGFVTPDNDPNGPETEHYSEDIFIPPGNLGTARHGDVVEVHVQLSTRAKDDPDSPRFEGEIIGVHERDDHIVVGTLRQIGSAWQVVPDDPRHQDVIHIKDVSSGIQPLAMHKVVVERHERRSTDDAETGRLIEDLGHMNDKGVDILSIMRAYGLEEAFPAEVLAESQQISQEIIDNDVARRRDLRGQVVFTIDPADARDFDDALSSRVLENGNLELGVHIADVNAFVPIGSAMDKEAATRGTSAYLVDRVVTMLPPNLTNHLCSLVPEEDRLTHSVFMEVSPTGDLLSVDTAETVIHSVQRLTYQEVQAWMESGESEILKPDVEESLKRIRDLAQGGRKERFKQHALDVVMPEFKVILDEHGEVERIERREPIEAYHLVEECMLLANKAVGALLHTHYGKAIYRIHEAPAEGDWEKMEADLRNLGIGNVMVSRETLNQIIGPKLPEGMRIPVTLAILKNLKRAMYSETLGEHFGLAFDTYSHFTSPIRRYPDLIAHRLLCAIERKETTPYGQDELKDLSRHCSDREQNAEEAEKKTIEAKRIRYYQQQMKKGEVGPWPAVITGVIPKGLLVELAETAQRGLIAYSSLGDDYYEVNEAGTVARGRRGQKTFHVGDTISVILARVDEQRKLVDFVVDTEARQDREEKKQKYFEALPKGKRKPRGKAGKPTKRGKGAKGATSKSRGKRKRR